MHDARLLSVVVPCFDEEEVICETHRRLLASLERLPDLELELVYVDDGSRDRTAEILYGLAGDDPRVRVVRLSRNFGHQVALTAGLEHARGDAVVVIDADLQDPPELIPELVGRWREGADVVYGVREARERESRFKLWTAKAFYRVINRLSDTPIPLDAGDFRLLDRRVVDALRAMPERDRFVRGMVSWAGFRQTPVSYRREARRAGRTKYGLGKMTRFAADGIVSFSFAPLRLATILGFVTSFLALVGVVYTVVVWLLGETVHGWATLSVAILFLGGVQLIALGIIGEYVGRIYREVKRRPLYFVDGRRGEPLAPEPPLEAARSEPAD